MSRHPILAFSSSGPVEPVRAHPPSSDSRGASLLLLSIYAHWRFCRHEPGWTCPPAQIASQSVRGPAFGYLPGTGMDREVP
eukprot:scaffold228306_cov32-Attheya_sp.AAC.4